MDTSGYSEKPTSSMEGAPPAYVNQSYDPSRVAMEYPNQPVQSTVVPIVSHEPPLRDYLPWSIFNTMYMNFCCLGFIALVFSVKARDRNLVGDKLGARNYGGTARNLNISATVLTIIFSIIIIIICVSGAITLYSTVSSSYNQNSQGYYGK